MTRLPSPFRAPWWAAGPHRQTLMARVLRPDNGPPTVRERLETPDGDFFDVDWSAEPGPNAPVVVVLHGLEGSSRRRYVQSVCRSLFDRGVRTAAINFRGCSGEANRALRFYHSGDTADLAWFLDEIARRHPDRRRGAVGFSLGGNVVLKYAGERSDGGRDSIDALAAMSVPYDLDASAALIERSFMGRQYSAYFLRSLHRKIEMKRERLAEVLDMGALDTVTTIRGFDDAATAPLNGFANAADYYARSSSNRFLAGIRVPTLLLHAEDDPFLPVASIPRAVAAENPHLHLVVSKRGGHVGFLEGRPWAPRFWGESAIADFMADELQARRDD